MAQSRKRKRSAVSVLRRAMLFGVGSVLVIQEKMDTFIEDAVAKGQQAEDDGKQLVQEMRSRRKRPAPKIKDALDTRINRALERLDLPSQEDLDALDQHIASLSRRIDELKSNS